VSAQAAAASPALPRPGLVEQLLRDLGVTDALLLLRAKAIDKATHNLLTQAKDAVPGAGEPTPPDANRRQSRAANPASTVAAQSFPHGLAKSRPAMADRQPGTTRSAQTLRATPPVHR